MNEGVRMISDWAELDTQQQQELKEIYSRVLAKAILKAMKSENSHPAENEDIEDR